MHIYRISQFPTGDFCYRGTLTEAHAEMKRFPANNRGEARIELIDVGIDKEGVLNVLNLGDKAFHPVLRTWLITERGGLKEIPNGE